MNRYAKISPNGHYSERFKELELAIHTLSNNQSLGISYIINKGNHNKKFILSIVKFLKEIGRLVRDENGKNIHRYTTNTTRCHARMTPQLRQRTSIT